MKKYKCGCKKYYFKNGIAHIYCGKPKGKCEGWGVSFSMVVKKRDPEWWELW